MKSPHRITVLLLAACALSACASVSLQNTAQQPQERSAVADADCPDVTRLQAAHLYGSWNVELVQTGLRGTLTLRQHPEFSASLRGEFHIGNQRSIASGDVEDGEFNLDESRDGKTLYAFWTGKLVPSACGAEIRGQWQRVPQEGQSEPPAVDFILRRGGATDAP
jgi:glucose/arabinose dehydrogenase